jgi:hypothetical protein
MKQAIIGLVLGGGASISVANNTLESPSLRMYAPESDVSWMQYLYAMFGFMCNQGIIPTESTGNTQSGLAVYSNWLLYTMQLDALMDLYTLLYSNRVKIIPTTICSLFTEVTLSFFVMAAGTPHISGLVLNLGKYTAQERQLFRDMLMSNFGLATTEQSRGRVYIKAKDKAKLLAIIKPHLHSSRLTLFDKPKSSK